jgi:cytochrome c oxidase assembly factor CtaG
MNPGLLAALQSWDLDHGVVWALPFTLLLYWRGWRRLRSESSTKYATRHLVAFAAGLAVVAIAVASPLDVYGGVLLQVHMAQHMLLMMAAPPLLWLGQPPIPLLRGLPPRLAKRALQPILTSSRLRAAGRALTHPLVCWTTFATAIVVWHLPRLYEAGLRSDAWHHAQHACFFAAALLFWWPVVEVWPSRAVWPRWMMIPYLLAADLLNTALSAILSFSGHVIYPHYESVPRLLGLSALEDQALAGVIMWVPGSVAFLLPAVLLTVQLLQSRTRAWTPFPSTVRR